MPPRLPIGYSDFAQLRRAGLRYMDKSGMVAELVRSGSQALLLPRPRRFGKTLNMTMMRAFFDRETADAPALFAGLSVMEEGEEVTLRIPNHEVSIVYRTVFTTWLRSALPGGSGSPGQLALALLSGDEATFRKILQRLILESLSYFDLGGRQPEAVYQASIVGLLVHLEATHEVRSNRESGLGRYDVMVRPKQADQPGAVLELKIIDADENETPEVALESAMTQIRARAYATELRAAGATPVWAWAGVFDGKRAWVRVEEC